jgi:hypothetical protein
VEHEFFSIPKDLSGSVWFFLIAVMSVSFFLFLLGFFLGVRGGWLFLLQRKEYYSFSVSRSGVAFRCREDIWANNKKTRDGKDNITSYATYIVVVP